MPKIPTFESQAPFPGVNVSPDAAAAPFGAIARAGEQIQQTGMQAAATFNAMAEKERRAAADVKIRQNHYDVEDEVKGIAEKFKDRTDYENFDDDLQKDMDGLRAKFKDRFRSVGKSNDPEVEEGFERSFRHYQSQIRDVIRDKRREVINDEGVRVFYRGYYKDLDEYAAEADPVKREIIKSRVEANAWTMVTKKAISRLQAADAIAQFDVKAKAKELDLEKGAIISAIHSENPEGALPLIDASKFDETQKSTLKAAARDKARTVKKQIEEDTRQEAVDRVYKSLKSDWGDNYEMMFVSLANPQFQQDNKLDLTGKHTLEQLLGQEQQRREYQIRKAHDENWAKVMPRLIDNSLPAVTPQELAEYSRTNGLSQDQLAYANHRIGISPQDKPIHTDNSYWAQMFEGIKAGKDMRSQILEGGKPSLRKLSSEDVQELYRLQAAREVEGKAHYTSDPWFHIAEQQFRERLIGTINIDHQEAIEAKLKGQPIKQVKDSTFYYEALTTLMRSIELNKLKGEDIWKKAQELLNVYAVKQATQGEAAFSMPEPPDPKANKGRYIQDTSTGKVKRSNGKEWIDVEIH